MGHGKLHQKQQDYERGRYHDLSSRHVCWAPELRETPPEPAAGTLKREYFAVVSAQVLSIDWLELHREGHRRAVFDAQGARWVQP